MKVIVSGSSGFIGSALVKTLQASGHSVFCLVRDEQTRQANTIYWNPTDATLNSSFLEGADAVIHLAGESVAGYWSEAKKERILQSRVKGTYLLSKTIARLQQPPKVFLCASAVGFYGDRGNEVVTEESKQGAGFLANVCRDWEMSADAARTAGVRVVHLRFGMVLSSQGGALPKMLTPFKLGLGGVIGSGSQYISWITRHDAVRAIQFALETATLQGPVNVVTPQPVTNREFTKSLGRALKRPTLFPMPGFVARVAFGPMADEVLLAGANVQPGRLLGAGFQFHQSELADAFESILNKTELQ